MLRHFGQAVELASHDLAAADGAVQDALVEDAPERGRTRSVQNGLTGQPGGDLLVWVLRVPVGAADRIARAYSSVCSRPGTTSGSYQRRTVAWASMSAHSWNQPYRRCLWPFFRWSRRRVSAPRGVQLGYRVEAGREVLGGRPLPRLDLADHVVRDGGPGGQVLLGQACPGPVEAQLRAEHARGRPGSVGIVRHLFGILSGRAGPGRRSVGIRADPVSDGSPRATGCETQIRAKGEGQ